ncbi:putative nucleotidyltransferase/HEPN domain-containing protein [Novosphingobium sp. SG751A]|uniref:nucleotidyltransferase and HEPN domain-containing protein n=1 Tax=Novosphingobium sp. SG751A TaxID=2587000 RepID=UPI001556589C|nr:HEPN domain-containing protein [Novosphingobium sp. SG751A]NOW47524.1 putative nucleotidyltransferase/HEPN domain-containing protein [Novosphingobium sp. SG751A]
MKTGLDHLPAPKQRELDRVVQLLFEEFDGAHMDAKGRRRTGKIVKIILYGSHARGGWVDEPHTTKGYRSDFDLLIIVSQKELADRAAYWTRADERLIEEMIAGRLRTPVNFIVHSLQQVNDGLSHGRFFFMDIAREGIAIYESDDRELSRPVPKTPQANLDMAREYFEEWFPGAMRRNEFFRFGLEKGHLKETAFELHQVTESLYNCVLLVSTFYTPHNHNIVFLRTQAERLDLRLFNAWPRELRKDRALFEKLKDAYVKARYSKHYRISAEELSWLGERVEVLGRIVHTICTERLAALETAVKG